MLYGSKGGWLDPVVCARARRCRVYSTSYVSPGKGKQGILANMVPSIPQTRQIIWTRQSECDEMYLLGENAYRFDVEQFYFSKPLTSVIVFSYRNVFCTGNSRNGDKSPAGNFCTITHIVLFCGTAIDMRSCVFPRNIPSQLRSGS